MLKKSAVATACLGIAAVGLAVAQPSAPAFDRQVLHVQVLLDRAGFSPGVIDGKQGQSLDDAIKGFQTARGLDATGALDDETRAALFSDRAPALGRLKIDARDLEGPFVFPFPKEPAAQAKLGGLGYRNAIEKLAEKFHTTPATIVALNAPGTPLRAGQPLVLPNVLPASRSYPERVKPEHGQLLSDLNVSAVQPEGDRVVVDKSERVLRVYAGERLIAQFPATMGSKHDPLPLGSWTIKGTSYLPPYLYQPDILRNAKGNKELELPPGPNSPVGVVWLDLSKPHYGIHGTPEPHTIGRAESNGCIRLTNWDAARLSLMVKPGTKAVFQA